MKRIVVFLMLIYLNSHMGICQLLSKPSLTVEDIEMLIKYRPLKQNIK